MLLGGVGAVCRFLLDRAVSARHTRGFPFGTLAVNLSGAFLLGFLGGLALNPHAALLAGHRVRRLLHDVLHLDAGNPAARRGAPDLACHRQHRSSASHSA